MCILTHATHPPATLLAHRPGFQLACASVAARTVRQPRVALLAWLQDPVAAHGERRGVT